MCAHAPPRSACSLPGPPAFTQQYFLSTYCVPGPLLDAGDTGGGAGTDVITAQVWRLEADTAEDVITDFGIFWKGTAVL